MKTLSRLLVQSSTNLILQAAAAGNVAPLPERVIQFGEGNFLRAFVDWMIDGMNRQGLFNGSVLVVQPIPEGNVEALTQQDGLYTLALRGVENGKVLNEMRVITALSRCINPYSQWAEFLASARKPELRYAVSNTTEAGIEYVPTPFSPEECPKSFPAKVARFLWERYQFVKGDSGKGLVFLPCELIEQNGQALRNAVMRHAQDWALGADFYNWVTLHCHFLNTLVDRIVPGFPHNEAEEISRQLDCTDRLLDTGEWFHLWVIEGPEHLSAEFPVQQAGFNVIWTQDLQPYRDRKVRILNGAHTSTALAAYLAGLDTVGDIMKNPVASAFLRQAVFHEIIPSFAAEDKAAYANAVLDRFQNPFIRHELLSISLNSVSKWKVRVLPSLKDFLLKENCLPAALCFSLAALIQFYQGHATSNDSSMQGCRLRSTREERYQIKDKREVLKAFNTAWQQYSISCNLGAMVESILGNASLWDEDLNSIPGLAKTVCKNLNEILEKGMCAAMQSCMNPL